MVKRLKPLMRACIAFVCAIAVGVAGMTVFADETVEGLEEKTINLQNELNELNQKLETLSGEITELTAKIDETKAAAEKAQLDLAAAKLNEEMQYEAMKKRIKYMYEGGSMSMLELLCTSQSMGEFLNKAEFVQNVSDYDRKMLEELQQFHADVQEKEENLEAEQALLEEMMGQMEQQQQELSASISSASGELQASKEALAEARAAQEAAQKALEEKAAAEEAAKRENTASGSSSGAGSSGSVPANTADVVLLAAILQCEAGTSDYDALLAVATVVMNRVASSRYPNTVQGVIYQSGQFSPTWNGSLSRVLASGPSSLCYQVATDALGGARLSSVSGCYQFRASTSGHAGTIVGGNVFF